MNRVLQPHPLIVLGLNVCRDPRPGEHSKCARAGALTQRATTPGARPLRCRSNVPVPGGWRVEGAKVGVPAPAGPTASPGGGGGTAVERVWHT